MEMLRKVSCILMSMLFHRPNANIVEVVHPCAKVIEPFQHLEFNEFVSVLQTY